MAMAAVVNSADLSQLLDPNAGQHEAESRAPAPLSNGQSALHRRRPRGLEAEHFGRVVILSPCSPTSSFILRKRE